MEQEQKRFYQVFSKNDPYLIVHYLQLQFQHQLFRKIQDLGNYLLVETENQEESTVHMVGDAIFLEKEKIESLENWLNAKDYETVEVYPVPEGILVVHYTFIDLSTNVLEKEFSRVKTQEERDTTSRSEVALMFLSVLFFFLWLLEK